MRALIVTLLPSLLILSPVMTRPASAQIRLFKDGQIVTIGPTRAERRARQMGVMRGAMSGRRPAPDAGGSQPVPDQTANRTTNLAPNRGIIRDVERAR
jgi:hypothetical protein